MSETLCVLLMWYSFFFFSSRRRHTRCSRDWSSDVCSSDLVRVNFFRGSFDSLNDPAAAFRLGQMHEVGANGATVDATSLFGQLAGKTLKVRVLERLENAQRI